MTPTRPAARLPVLAIVLWLILCRIKSAQSGGAAAPARTSFATQHSLPAQHGSVHDITLKVWEEHVMYMRHYIISAAANLPDKEAVAERLLRNQEDIGNAMKPHLGIAAGEKFTGLLKEHVRIAFDVISSAIARDDAKQKEASQRWNKNADDIAAFLHDANPKEWPLDEMQNLMREHLQLTADVIAFRVGGHWNDDIAAHDKVHRQILKLADTLTAGITKQSPDKTTQRP
jgi:hypothetical protein